MMRFWQWIVEKLSSKSTLPEPTIDEYDVPIYRKPQPYDKKITTSNIGE
jgi:hypothetical protein|tara:strand:+ start:354 stop:500 length:147 start_codon:yes stop_codon:yes gene_type:complete